MMFVLCDLWLFYEKEVNDKKGKMVFVIKYDIYNVRDK